MAVIVRHGGRRYPQVTCAAALVLVGTSLGSPAAPAITIAHRRYPQSTSVPMGSSRGVRVFVGTSVGTPTGSSGSASGFSRAQAVNNTMEPLKQSTARNLMVFLVDSADHVTGKTSLTLTITASKDGAAFASITPTVTERGSGWYNLALTSSHTDTLGDLAFHITGSGADACDLKLPVEVDRTGATVSSVTGNVAGNVTGTVASVVGAVGSVTGNVGGNVAGSVGSLATQAKADVNVELASVLTATIADSIPADGTRPSISQGIYMLTQFMVERSVSSTTLTVKKPDGTTTLFTLTLNDPTTPTSLTRTT